MEAKSEGWASGESTADDGLGAERVTKEKYPMKEIGDARIDSSA